MRRAATVEVRGTVIRGKGAVTGQRQLARVDLALENRVRA